MLSKTYLVEPLNSLIIRRIRKSRTTAKSLAADLYAALKHIDLDGFEEVSMYVVKKIAAHIHSVTG